MEKMGKTKVMRWRLRECVCLCVFTLHHAEGNHSDQTEAKYQQPAAWGGGGGGTENNNNALIPLCLIDCNVGGCDGGGGGS